MSRALPLPHRLELEITEGSLMRNAGSTTAVVEELARLGVGGRGRPSAGFSDRGA